jgi:aldehyde dehydrogenase (NAD+)
MSIMISFFVFFFFCFEQVSKIEDSFDMINSGTKPLAAYLFTNNKKLKEQFVMSVSAGGVVINDIAMHVIILL